jgi:hypothetical protein
MYYKKIKGLLFSIFTIGVTLTPSDSWSMVPAYNDNGHILGGVYVPEDLLLSLFWHDLTPIEWVRAGEICKNWYNVSNHKELWVHLNGQTPRPYEPKDNEEKIQALTTLFKTIPSLQKLFSIDLSKTRLEACLPEAIKNPTVTSYKFYFISQYLESVAQSKSISYIYRNSLQVRHHILRVKANEYMEKSYEQGNIKAARKRESRIIEDLIQDLEQQNPLQLLLPGCQNTDATPKHYLTAVLLGSSKAEKMFAEHIMNHLANSVWIRTLLEPDYLASYKGNTPKGSTFYQAEEKLDALINFGNAWPGAIRESILKGTLTGPHIAQDLEAIGEGKRPVNLFGKPFTLEWPEAYCILGKNHQHDNDIAKFYFEKAIVKGVQKSRLSLAESLKTTLENQSSLQGILKEHPHSGIVLAKLGQILIGNIPDGVEATHESVNEFLNFFREAYGRLGTKRRGLVCGSVGDGAYTSDFNWVGKIKKPEDIIEYFGNSLRDKSRDIQCTFLDLLLEGSSYLELFNGFLQVTIANHFANKWYYDDAFKDLIIYRRVNTFPTETLNLEDNWERWDEKDTRYSFLYFDQSINPRPEIQKRKFYSSLMTIALKKKKKDWFIKAFESFCLSIGDEEIGLTNYKLLRANKNKFVKLFSKDTEVERLFNIIPQPAQKIVQKRKASSNDSSQISSSAFKKARKRTGRDEDKHMD